MSTIIDHRRPPWLAPGRNGERSRDGHLWTAAHGVAQQCRLGSTARPGWWQASEVSRELVDEDALVMSAVVANNAMNRERRLSGVNSYSRELGFDLLDWLRARTVARRTGTTIGPRPSRIGWLDLCCGRGRALLHAAEELRDAGIVDQFLLMGVDLVDAFDDRPQPAPVTLVTASVVTWQPPQPFDLITCVHGLHYIGDKLSAIAHAVGTLTQTGLFIADFDVSGIRQPDGRPFGRAVTAALRRAGIDYDARRHQIRCQGHRQIDLPFEYLGADDGAGPNYTGQPAVHSYYQPR
jgi:SAM-dependent methyltransferase